MDPVEKILGKKRSCKYCGKVHKHEPFVDCHDPSEPLPDDLGGTYRSFDYEEPFILGRR